ncbi:ankyrin repeat domain-containing protein [Nannocystis sp. SCPEA4]|uniref:ankyrin repeat domain-containing protein n=1 Tax=Nannocystis sp. SCPEA4 TaxID=2996787 RepID=UPI00226EEC5A|nr:ankyrin repeat domain-containing protein [Nannocystis sp. SCPEA4]MCY1055535.1 ankyrin repeat domain-containing protein [Nannocystis sp. SCPEA4]
MRIEELVGSVERGAADEVAAAVLADPALLSARTADGDTLLHVACWQKQAAIVAVLLARGADANARGFHGRTALHYAVHDGREVSVAIVRSLLDHGADPTLRDAGGHTPDARAQQEMWGPALDAVLAQLSRPPAAPAPVGDDYAEVVAQVRALEAQGHTLVALSRLLAGFTDGPGADAQRAADGLPAADPRCLADAQRVLDAVATTSWATPLREWLRTEATPALLEQLLRSYRQSDS